MQIRYVLCDANRRGECMFMCVYSWHVHMCVCRYTCIYCIIVFLGTRALCARACMYIIHDMPATGLVSASYVFKASECYRGIYINCINNFMAGSFPPGWCCVDIYTNVLCVVLNVQASVCTYDNFVICVATGNLLYMRVCIGVYRCVSVYIYSTAFANCIAACAILLG